MCVREGGLGEGGQTRRPPLSSAPAASAAAWRARARSCSARGPRRQRRRSAPSTARRRAESRHYANDRPNSAT
eukprot:5384777-Pleurochrysis_carterae.AAC.2